jgi:hypothetical protein
MDAIMIWSEESPECYLISLSVSEVAANSKGLLMVFQQFWPDDSHFLRGGQGRPHHTWSSKHRRDLESLHREPETAKRSDREEQCEYLNPRIHTENLIRRSKTELQEASFPQAEGCSKARAFTETTEDPIADHIRLNPMESGIGVIRAAVKTL